MCALSAKGKDFLIQEIERLKAEREMFLKSSAVGYTALTRVKYEISKLNTLPDQNFSYLDDAIKQIANEDAILREICVARARVAR